MKQLIEQQLEEFEDLFCDREMVVKDGITQIKYKPTQDAIFNWHKQSLKQFIDELIAREEGEIKEFQTQKDGEYHFGENQKTIGWNLAKELTIVHLKEIKENITN